MHPGGRRFEPGWLHRSTLASLPEDAADGIRTRAREAATRYETPTGLDFPGVTLLAYGLRG